MIHSLFARAHVIARFQQSLLQPHLGDIAARLQQQGYSHNVVSAPSPRPAETPAPPHARSLQLIQPLLHLHFLSAVAGSETLSDEVDSTLTNTKPEGTAIWLSSPAFFWDSGSVFTAKYDATSARFILAADRAFRAAGDSSSGRK